MLEKSFTKLLCEYPEALKDRRQFTSILKDLMPGRALQTNLLINLYDLGIAPAISAAKQIEADFIYRYTKLLCDDYGVSRRNADWAVAVWCESYASQVLGIEVKQTSTAAAALIPSDEDSALNIGPELSQTLDISTNKQTFDWRNVYDYTIENNGVIIEKYVDFDEPEVSIPEMIEGYPVVEIGDGAFYNCIAMKHLRLPASLRVIRRKAFENCTFDSIELPDSLTEIEYLAFGSCKLHKIDIPQRVRRVNRYVFSGCENLASVNLPEQLKSIEGYAFSNCKALETLDVPTGTSEIGELAFQQCPMLKKIRIPRSVTTLGRHDSESENIFGEITRQNLTIYCQPGSEVLVYARKYGIKMEPYDGF